MTGKPLFTANTPCCFLISTIHRGYRTPIEPQKGATIHQVALGEIGRTGTEKAEKINKDIAGMIPKLEACLEAGHLKPLDYVQVGDVAVGEILKALETFNNHRSGKKLVVRLAEN